MSIAQDILRAKRSEAKEDKAKILFTEPKELSDFLYEMQMELGLGVDAHRKHVGAHFHDGTIKDYSAFYEHLQLSDSVVSQDEFKAVASGKKDPSRKLIEYLADWLPQHYAPSVVNAYHQAINVHLGEYEKTGLNSYQLGQFITRKLGDSQSARFRLANHLGIYPSALTALERGDIVASKSLREKLYDELNATPQQRDAFAQNSVKYMEAIRQTDPARAMVMTLLGDTQRDTSLLSVMQATIYAGSPITKDLLFERAGEKAEVVKEALEAVYADERDEHKTLNKRYYDPKQVKALATAMLPGKKNEAIRQLLLDIGSHRPFGVLLEEYMQFGGRSWPEFLNYVAADWQESSQSSILIAQATGISKSRISTWRNYDGEEPLSIDPRSLTKIVKNIKPSMTGRQKDYLWALAGGSPTHEMFGDAFDMEDVIARAQHDMQALPAGAAREAYSVKLFQALLQRNGLTPSAVVSKVGGSEASIHKMAQASVDEGLNATWVAVAPKVAKALCPEGSSEEMVRDLQLLLLGVPRYRTPQELLNLVMAEEITIGNMAREIRLQHGMGPKVFAQHVGMEHSKYVGDLYSYIENDSERKIAPRDARLVAFSIGLNELQRDYFVAASQGHSPWRESQVEVVLDAVLEGRASFSDVVAQIMNEKYAHLINANGVGIHKLAEDVGVSPHNVRGWYSGGKHVFQFRIAEKLAEVAGMEHRLEDFVNVARNTVARYDPSVLTELSEASTLEERQKGLKKMIRNQGMTYELLANKLQVEPGIVARFVQRGHWSSVHPPLTEVAEALISDEYSEQRPAFCRVFGRAAQMVEKSEVLQIEASRN